MTRLLLLLAAVVTLNACEKHKASDLPDKYLKGTKHEAAKDPAAEPAKAPATH